MNCLPCCGELSQTSTSADSAKMMVEAAAVNLKDEMIRMLSKQETLHSDLPNRHPKSKNVVRIFTGNGKCAQG